MSASKTALTINLTIEGGLPEDKTPTLPQLKT